MKKVQKILMLILLMFKIWIKGDGLLLFFMLSVLISLILVVLQVGFQYFMIALTIATIYMILMLRRDTVLKKNHFYKIMSITNQEIYLVKLLYFFFFYTLLLLLFDYAVATLLLIHIEIWKLYFVTMALGLLPIISHYYTKYNRK